MSNILRTFVLMMQIKTQAIVLRTVKYGEKQLIVDLLTATQGRVSFLVSVSSSKTARVKKQLFQPLTLLRVEYRFKPNARLQHLQDVGLDVPFASIPFDVVKQSLVLFLTEFLYNATWNEPPNEPLFSYLRSSLLWLDQSKGNLANYHLVLMIHLSRFLGFFPNLTHYRAGCFFDLRDAVFTTECPSHPDYLAPQEAQHLGLLTRLSFETMHVLKLTRAQRHRTLNIIVHYYRLHLPQMNEMRSLDVLGELFA